MCEKYKDLTEDEKQKKREISLKHYYKNREARLAYQKEYNMIHRNKHVQYQKEYYMRNKEMLLEDKKKYYQESSKWRLKRDENLRYQKAYYRGTNLIQSTWKAEKMLEVEPVKLIHTKSIISFD